MRAYSPSNDLLLDVVDAGGSFAEQIVQAMVLFFSFIPGPVVIQLKRARGAFGVHSRSDYVI